MCVYIYICDSSNEKWIISNGLGEDSLGAGSLTGLPEMTSGAFYVAGALPKGSKQLRV